jgi:thymidylate synthase (FAD)
MSFNATRHLVEDSKNRGTFVDTPKIFILARSAISTETEEIYAYFGTPEPPMNSAPSVERIVEIAGRTCYLSFHNPSGKSTADYNENLIRHNHESVLEHASWTFILAGVSRAFTHQLVRHRIGFSFSQLSQQYVDHRSTRFVIPAELLKDPELLLVWKKSVLAQRDIYIDLVESSNSTAKNLNAKERIRSVRSVARSILPNCTEAAIAVTGNARAWRHFLELRGSTEGDIEMRRVSALLLSTLKNEAPSLFFDFTQTSLGDGWPIVKKVTEPRTK